MSGKKQLTLFGKFTKSKIKKYKVYRDPEGKYECYIERYCLRELSKNPHRKLRDVHSEAQKEWKKVVNDIAAQESYLKLREKELPFVRYDENGFETNEIIPTSSLPSFVQVTPRHQEEVTCEEPSDANVVEVCIKRPRVQPVPVPDCIDLLTGETEEHKTCASRKFNQKLVERLGSKLCPELLTEDVLNNDSFIDSVASNIRPLLTYLEKYENYKVTHTRERKDTDLYKSMTSINRTIESLKCNMYAASEIEIRANSGLSRIIASGKAKEEKLKDILTKTLEISRVISESNINNKLQKRTTQATASNKAKIKKVIHHNDLRLKCLNASASWERAFIDAENRLDLRTEVVPNLISMTDVISTASDIQSEFCVLVRRLQEYKRDELIDLIVEIFPVMLAEKNNMAVLIDIQELLINKDAFVTMLSGGDETCVLEDDDQAEQKEEAGGNNLELEQQDNDIPDKKNRGRTPIYVKFPTLIDVATTFIKEHSFSAHVRRRETTATGAGVTLANIQKHLLENVPGLKDAGGIHRDTIHRLTVAPRKNSIRAARYKGLIDARVPGKRNQYREESKNQHFLFSRVRYREEFVARFYEEAQFYSCDDMNKIRMGPATAVSRYHQIFRFFSTNDSPNVGDHDFPNPGYLIVPSGYMALTSIEQKEEICDEYVNDELNDYVDIDRPEWFDGENRCDEVTEDENSAIAESHSFVSDKLGRQHYQKFSAGPSLVKLRSCMFGQSSGMTHANDILPILTQQVKDGKGIAFLKVDNGSDWNLHSLVNIVFMGRVWKESELDVLGIVSYAARYSAYNNIEHLWSPLSKSLSSVILPSILEEDSEEPNKQNLEEEQRRQKEAQIFDNAMNMVTDKYWSGKEFNGSEVSSTYKPCRSNEHPYNDYKEIHKLLTGGINNLRGSKLLLEEVRLLLKHLDRKSNELIFRKCANPRCEHCPSHPILAKKAWDFLKAKDFKWPNPKPSPTHDNHYMTFMEMCNVESAEYLIRNQGLPSNLEVGTCPYCENFVFLSDAEKKKHLSVFHHNMKGDGEKVWKTEHKCLYIIKDKQGSGRCNLLFKSANQLTEHKKQAKHINQRKKKNATSTTGNSPVKGNGKGKKQIRLEKMMKAKTTKKVHRAIVSSDSEDCEEPDKSIEEVHNDDVPSCSNSKVSEKSGKRKRTENAQKLLRPIISEDSDTDDSEHMTDDSPRQAMDETGSLEDLAKDRLYDHVLKSRHVNIKYEEWHMGTITWYNFKLDKYRVLFEDKSEDYVSIDDINGKDVVLI